MQKSVNLSEFNNVGELSTHEALHALRIHFDKYNHFYEADRIFSSKKVQAFISEYTNPNFAEQDAKKVTNNLNVINDINNRLLHKEKKALNASIENTALNEQNRLLEAENLCAFLDHVEKDLDALTWKEKREFSLFKYTHILNNAVPEHLKKLDAELKKSGGELYKQRHTKKWDGEMSNHMTNVFIVQQKIAKYLKNTLGYATPFEGSVNVHSPGTNVESLKMDIENFSIHNKRVTEYASKEQAKDTLASIDDIYISPKRKIDFLNHIVAKTGTDMSRGKVYFGGDYCKGGPKEANMMVSNYKDFLTTIIVAIHESGHADQTHGLPQGIGYIGRDAGKHVQEITAMYKEFSIVVTPQFMELLSKELAIHFPEYAEHPAFNADQLYKRATRINHTVERKDADSLSVNSHYVSRMELDEKFMNGETINPETFPDEFVAEWRAGEIKNLGIENNDPNSKSHMQDFQYWSNKYFAYFPCYIQGAFAQAQIDAYLKREVFTDMDERIRNGDFKEINAWFDENIHQHGAYFTIDELIEGATGEKLTSKYLIKKNYETYAKPLLTEGVLQEIGFDKHGNPTPPPAKPKGVENLVAEREADNQINPYSNNPKHTLH